MTERFNNSREMSSSDNKPLRHVPLAVIFDLDDTLIDTQLAIDEALYPALEAQNMTREEFAAERVAYKQRTGGKSLDAYSFVRNHQNGGEQAWQDVATGYVDRAKTVDLWLPGAKNVLATLEEADVPFGIKTYGSEEMQLLKHEAMGLDDSIPFHIINHRNKGEMLSAMYNPEHDGFEVKWLGVVASRVVMFENDPSAFAGLEQHIAAGRVQSIWIPHTDSDRNKPVPAGVTEVVDMSAGMQVVADWADEPRLAA